MIRSLTRAWFSFPTFRTVSLPSRTVLATAANSRAWNLYQWLSPTEGTSPPDPTSSMH